MQGTEPISNTTDVIDSRDVIARIDYLTGIIDGGLRLDEDEREELAALQALAQDGESYAADWLHGATLIHEDYFETYAEQLAEDIGAVSRDLSWPLNHIDWEAAADELKQDYSSIDFDGQTYWVSAA